MNGKKATPPCPCGYLGHYAGKCHCSPQLADLEGGENVTGDNLSEALRYRGLQRAPA